MNTLYHSANFCSVDDVCEFLRQVPLHARVDSEAYRRAIEFIRELPIEIKKEIKDPPPDPGTVFI